MRFIHAADIHLDSPLYGLERYEGAPVEEVRGATRRAFENLVDLCGEEKVELLLLAGDLYDGDWKDFGTGLFFSSQMARLRDMGVQVLIVRGNHDAASRITKSLRLPDKVFVFDSRRPETYVDERLGIAVHGQSFANRDTIDNLAAGYPEPRRDLLNVGLLHTSADGRPGHAPYAPCRLQELVERGYDYWALGHVHAREVLHRNPWVVFPGNLQGRHAREVGPKGCTLIEIADGDVLSVEERHVDVMRWRQVDLDASECRDDVDVLDKLRAALGEVSREAAGGLRGVRVRITGSCPAHRRLIERRDACIAEARSLALDVGSGSIWLEKVLIETSPGGGEAGVDPSGGVLGELVRYIDEIRSNDEQMAGFVARLNDVNAKLPAEVRSGEDAFEVNAATLRRLLGDGETLLLQGLIGGGASR